jgi:hypothetical protein
MTAPIPERIIVAIGELERLAVAGAPRPSEIGGALNYIGAGL